MKRSTQQNIDNLVSKILNEEIETKVRKITKEISEGEWKEIVSEKKLSDKQKFIAKQAKPVNKITSKDFEKLRQSKSKKRDMDEALIFPDPDEEEEEEMKNMLGDLNISLPPQTEDEGLGSNKWDIPYKPKYYGSFDDEHGWYDDLNKPYEGGFEFDYDEENYPDFESLIGKYKKDQPWFDPETGKQLFDKYQERFKGKPFRVRKKRTDESETEEGNAFGKAVQDAKNKNKDKFEFGGKSYDVKESSEEKWIQKTEMKKGALHKKLGVPEGNKIPESKLKSLKKELSKKAEGDKKLSPEDSKLLKQVNLALTLKGIKESKRSLRLNEEELISMIEKIVLIEKDKENISMKTPIGLKKTQKVQGETKKENDNYAKDVIEKIKKYVKSGTVKGYKENSESFPQSNYQLGKMKEKTMKYHPSDAVEEYIEAFAFPGQTNLVFDEIKPDDEKIEKYLKGDSTTGNAVKDKDGKALGNVVPSEVGKRFMKNYEDNLYGAEQMQVSYKRQPQPVDVGGTEKMQGSLKSIRKGSGAKAQKIMSQLESVDDSSKVKINEDISKMKNLISYNSKTQ